MIAALPDEHFRIGDVKRVLVKVFRELEFNGQSRRPRTDNAGFSSMYQRRKNASYPRRYRSALATGHQCADTESVDEEADVNSADLLGSCEVNRRRCRLELTVFQRFVKCFFSHEESAKLENAAMKLSAVHEALVTVRAASDEMKGKSEGKGEPAVSCSGKGKRRWRKSNSAKHLQDKFAARQYPFNMSCVRTTLSLGWCSWMHWNARHEFHDLVR